MTSLLSPISRLRFLLVAEPARWLRPLLVVGMLALSVAIPRLFSEQDIWFLLGLPLGVAGLLLFLRWPPLGLVLLIPVGMFVPFEISTGSNTTVNATILLLALLSGLWVIQLVTSRSQATPIPARILAPLLALLLIALLAFLAGQLPWFPFAGQTAPLTAQLGGLMVFVLSAAAFLLAAHQLRDLRWLQWLTWLFLALGGLVVAGALLRPGPGEIILRFFQRDAAGSLFWVWLVALAFGQALFNKQLHPGWRMALVGLVAASLYFGAVLNSGWRAGYIPPLAAVAAIIALRSWRAALAVVLLGAVPAWLLVNDALVADEYSYSTRTEAWLLMYEIIRVNPLLGFGPANYYWYTPLFRIRGFYVPFNAHSQYVDMVAQIGLLGLASFLWFVFEVGRLGWRLRRKVPEGFAKAYVFGAMGGLAGTLFAGILGDWIIPFVYNVGLSGMRASIMAWIFLGGLVALGQMQMKSEASPQ
ncbi:MAG: O-antigen ligase family protein [Chloroflexota bacterium]|nr:MAG: O-antigen ligase family protein [Chloroflexota bacterium]